MPISDASEYLHYGCGTFAPQGWTNYDISPTARIQKIWGLGWLGRRLGPVYPKNVLYGDIVAGLPVKPATCKVAFCQHVLEHLALEDFRIAIRNTLTYLKPGGIFRMVMPDMEYLARQYVQSTDPGACLKFMEDTYIGWVRRPRGFLRKARLWFGNSMHLWMWDYKSLARELEQAGFTGIRRAFFGDCADPRLAEVERIGYWENQLGAECIRPT